MRPRTTIRLTLIAVSLAVTVSLAEVPTLLGFDYRGLFGTPVSFDHSCYTRPDPELLYVHLANLHWSGTAPCDLLEHLHLPSEIATSFSSDCRWDVDGFRNEKEIHQADVAVIGDSFVEQPNLMAEQLFPSVLARRLDRPVVNLGQSGYGPQQELAVLKRFALKYNPKVIVWAFFEGNDLSEAIQYERVLPDYEQQSRRERSIWKRSFSRNLYKALRGFCNRNPQHARVPEAKRREGVLPNGQRMWFLYEGHSLSPEQSRGLKIVSKTLEDAAATCRTRGIKLLVAFLPTTYRVYHSLCRFEAGSDCASWVTDDLPERLARATGRLGRHVRYLDLTPALQQEAAKGRLVYFRDDTHWTAAGHDVAAQAIERLIGTHPFEDQS
jgi:hypothetical protein